MKKIFLSKITKSAVFALSLFCIFACVYMFFYIDNADFRLGETEYEKSYAFSSEIQNYMELFDNAIFEKSYSQKAAVLKSADSEKVKYYISRNGDELSNFDSSSEAYRGFTLYYLYDSSEDTAETNAYTLTGENYFPNYNYFTYICQTNGLDSLFIGFDTEGFSAEKSRWLNEKNNVNGYLRSLPFLAVIFVLCFVYVTVTAGRKYGTDEIKTGFIDRVWGEFIIAAGAFIFSAGLGFFVLIWDTFFYSGFSVYDAALFVGAETAAAYSLILYLWLSLVKSVKTKSFLNRFLIFRLLKKASARLKNAEDCCVSLAEHKLGGLSAYIPKITVVLGVVIFFLAIVLREPEIWLAEIPLIMFFLLLSDFAKFLNQTDKIKRGIEEIKSGNTDYKTEGVTIPYLKETAESLNEIGGGLTLSLENALKSERMKTELVTNVSHDLKTPLTSIINFSELLCKEELAPAEANEYAKIIHEKAKRLKSLTSDLFDMAKLQSGSEEMNFEKIDLCLLVRQTLAEYEADIKASKLEFITDFGNSERFITADGKKLSRAIGNLVENCLKYSLDNTRVYLTVSEKTGRNCFEIKNISKTRLSVNADELTERFVRGDSSRSTEGNGLGLAIAKNYTLANKADFNITTDGDLFKVKIAFPPA
ncbi:MAG: HAMP domain-containing histidine kinase [Clostridiales bacterium]|nr:HAMP domain-containing histidine kinase [Clostridiales bacterium]